jgi:hypothetical protein
MCKAGLAAIVALVIGSSSVLAGDFESESRMQAVKNEASMTIAQISRLKSVLKLSAEQERLWPAIEVAFREIKESQEEAGTAQGFVQRVKNKAASVGLNALAMRRLAAAAYPLIRTLTEEQKQSGLVFARSTGLDKIAAAF